MVYFEYRKMNDRYLIKKKMLNQIIKKVLPIREVFYPSYKFLFIFNNTTIHLIYAKQFL